MSKETVIHMTLRGTNVQAEVSYTDKDDAAVTRIIIEGEGGALLKAGVFSEIEDNVFAMLPEIIANERADAAIEREMLENPIVRMTAELDDALVEALR